MVYAIYTRMKEMRNGFQLYCVDLPLPTMTPLEEPKYTHCPPVLWLAVSAFVCIGGFWLFLQVRTIMDLSIQLWLHLNR
jgi:hypothetical protein